MKTYLGLDIGSISTKGVLIREDKSILASAYLWTQGDPIAAVKQVLHALQNKTSGSTIRVAAVGTTGSARRLIGAMTDAAVVKNEITAHAVGTLSQYPDVRTIFEIGGQDSKIILIENGFVVDYAMNTLCAAGTGAFLSSQAQRLGVAVEDFGTIALTSKKPTSIAARCTVFAESDLVHKAQMGHKKEDIIAGLCRAVVSNFLNNVGKGKGSARPSFFRAAEQNIGVKKAFEDATGFPVKVDENGHLTGALGAAILAANTGFEVDFRFGIADIEFLTRGIECGKCANRCEIICVYREDKMIDAWGNKCEKGALMR